MDNSKGENRMAELEEWVDHAFTGYDWKGRLPSFEARWNAVRQTVHDLPIEPLRPLAAYGVLRRIDELFPLQPRLALAAACEEAAVKFLEYARLHRLKGTRTGEEKAQANEAMASKLRAAISAHNL